MEASSAPGLAPQAEALVQAVAGRAEAFFRWRKLLCAEAVLAAVSETFGSPISEAQAVGLAAGLTAGLGDRGCLCGAVAGACAAVGIVCAEGTRPDARAAVRGQAAAIHEAFTARHKSACCRVLTKAVKDDPAAHMDQCAGLTGYGAELAARAVLSLRPELAACPEAAAARPQSRLCGRIKWLLSFLCR